MSVTNIPHKVVVQLWMRAGGRCEFPGCNDLLWRDDITTREINAAYIAHIVADQPDGPRGDPVLSPLLAKNISNLMLMCDTHHRLIDAKDNVPDYPVELLKELKCKHEERIELLTSIDVDRKTNMVFFTDNIGNRKHAFGSELACAVVKSGRYPAEPRAILIDLSNSPFRDHEQSYFESRQDEVRRLVDTHVKQRTKADDIKHLSIFALAGIPLLVQFGCEIGDTIPSDLYQFHRDTGTWEWQPASPLDQKYIIESPDDTDAACQSNIVLNLSLSGVIHANEISAALPTHSYCTYKMTIPYPNRDYLKSKEQLELFADEMRALLARIRGLHGSACCIHVFPAVPAPIAVKLGQLLLPKSDPDILVYDHHKDNGGFRYALSIPPGRKT